MCEIRCCFVDEDLALMNVSKVNSAGGFLAQNFAFDLFKVILRRTEKVNRLKTAPIFLSDFFEVLNAIHFVAKW